MKSPDTTNHSWEEEFDKEFHTPNAGTAWGDMSDVKDFIRNLLASRDAFLREKIEGMKYVEHEYKDPMTTPPMTEPKREADDYNRHYSHYHCWDQKQPSACGQDLKDHKQCCLCDTVAPKRESGCEDCGEITCSGSCGVPEICKSSQDPNEKCPSAKSSVGPCKFHQSHQESWIQELRDRGFAYRNGYVSENDFGQLIDFISQLLTSARKEERRILGEKLKELRLSGPTWVGEHAKKLDNYSYNRALDDTLQALDQ